MRTPEFWTRKDALSRFWVHALTPLGWIYGASVLWRARNAMPYRSAAKVICVGNLTVGGTGKTPVAAAIARALLARGRHPVFLSRGYGGRLRGPILVSPDNRAVDVGDEPLVLAATAPVVVARDRREGARLAVEQGADAIIMDDGHQNFDIVKDLSILVVDGETGFGNGRILPAGPLRESVPQGAARADAAVIVGEGAPLLPGLSGPVLRAHLEADSTVSLAGRRVVAFAGIGRPEKFFRSLAQRGADVVHARRYGDHHVYSPAQIARLKAKGRAQNALLVTTEKDFVRLTPAEREGILMLPVRAAFDDTDALEHLLDRIGPAR